MSAFTWYFINNTNDAVCEAVILCDGAEVDREGFDDPKAANAWVRGRLTEMGAL